MLLVPLEMQHHKVVAEDQHFSQLYLFPPLRFKVSFVYQHREHHSDQLVRSGQDGHLVYESVFSSFKVVRAKDLVVDNHLGRHEPDNPAEVAIPPLADFALSLILA